MKRVKMLLGDVPLLGYCLRGSHPKWWTRLYYWPNKNKKGASTRRGSKKEACEFLDALISSLVDVKHEVMITVAAYRSAKEQGPKLLSQCTKSPAVKVVSYTERDIDGDGEKKHEYTIFAAHANWNTIDYYPMFRSLMDENSLRDNVDSMLIIDVQKGVVIAPYPYGVDVFIKNKARRDATRRYFRTRVSPRKDGL